MNWSAIITTYNSGSVIEQAVDSLLSLPSSEAPVDIVVVDNDSSDCTMDTLAGFSHRITTVRNGRNLGLAAANNIGAARAKGDSLFFLNPDVVLLPGAAVKLHEFAEKHPDAALLGPAMLDGSGNVQSTARTWPSIPVIASRRSMFSRTAAGRRISADHLNRFSGNGRPVKADWLVGAALWLTPAGRERAGLMSESYFLYFEDVEWCWRAWKSGMEVWYVPEAEIHHVCRRESASGGTTLNYHIRSMIRFLITHPLAIAGFGPGRRK